MHESNLQRAIAIHPAVIPDLEQPAARAIQIIAIALLVRSVVATIRTVIGNQGEKIGDTIHHEFAMRFALDGCQVAPLDLPVSKFIHEFVIAAIDEHLTGIFSRHG
jgi:hypothetical protein